MRSQNKSTRILGYFTWKALWVKMSFIIIIFCSKSNFFSPVLLYASSFVLKCKIDLLKVSNKKTKKNQNKPQNKPTKEENITC